MKIKLAYFINYIFELKKHSWDRLDRHAKESSKLIKSKKKINQCKI